MRYSRATVTTTSDFADTLSVILIDLGSEGVCVTDSAEVLRVLRTHDWDYADETLLNTKVSADAFVTAFYPDDYDFSALIEKLNALRGEQGAGTLELAIDKIDSADYENEWKKYYKPIEVDKLVVVPEWLSYAGKCPCVVRLDPGMAFGTGSHETTKLCLKLMQTVPLAGAHVADIGCGSGILGAAALELGAKDCFMADLDPQAVDAAKKNCALNGVDSRAQIVQGSITASSGTFDIILANITADVLALICKPSSACLNKGGYMITSGIIHARSAFVKEAYSQEFALVCEESDGEWEAMIWQKR